MANGNPRSPRSPSYPSYTLEYCIVMVTKIYDNFGSGNYYAKRGEIAKTLGFSEAHLQTQVSSANQYGLLELKSGEGYKPSPLFVKIYKPIDEEQKQLSLIEAFKSPKLYVSLIEKFENQVLPKINPLSNILLQHFKISPTASEKAATIFVDNAIFLNLLNGENILRFSSNINVDIEDKSKNVVKKLEILNKNEESDKIPKDIFIDNSKGKEEQRRDNNFSEPFLPFNILLKGKRRAQLLLPNDIESNDFDTIINWMRLMKESF